VRGQPADARSAADHSIMFPSQRATQEEFTENPFFGNFPPALNDHPVRVADFSVR
jgi:hypothetical protein